MKSRMKEVFGWEENPFSFKILPEYFVGHQEDLAVLQEGIANENKVALLLGPTGSGKTTLLRYISDQFPHHRVIFLAKPPKDPQDWVAVFAEITRPGFFGRLFHRGNGIGLYNLSQKISSKLNSDRCLLFVDECHEATQESLEWLRAITDQVDNLTVVLAGLPIFENDLKDNLETYLRRVTVRVDLASLTPAETREFIKKRIEGVGGDDVRPFTSSVIDHIYQKTGGFPREVLRLCNELFQRALEKGLSTIDVNLLQETDLGQELSRDTVETLPDRQKLIMSLLAKEGELTPTEMVKKVQAKGEYKDTDNAIRSVNNLVRRLLSDGLVERKKTGKAYKYRISPRYQTLFIEA